MDTQKEVPRLQSNTLASPKSEAKRRLASHIGSVTGHGDRKGSNVCYHLKTLSKMRRQCQVGMNDAFNVKSIEEDGDY